MPPQLSPPLAFTIQIDVSVSEEGLDSTSAAALANALALSIASTSDTSSSSTVIEVDEVSSVTATLLDFDPNSDASVSDVAAVSATAACTNLTGGKCTATLLGTSVTVLSAGATRRRLNPAAAPSYAHPSECGVYSCCAVVYKYAEGSQCDAVPIWNFSSLKNSKKALVKQGEIIRIPSMRKPL